MTITAETILRFFGAALLGFGATVVDQRTTAPKPAPRASIPIRARAARAPVPLNELTIAPGKRAFSFGIKDLTGITGLIQRNSRVDIVAVRQEKGKGVVANIIIENLRVLAFAVDWVREPDDRDLTSSSTKPGSPRVRSYRLTQRLVTTVEVTPEEGARLAEASTQGELQLLLRGWGESEAASAPPVTSVVLPKR